MGDDQTIFLMASLSGMGFFQVPPTSLIVPIPVNSKMPFFLSQGKNLLIPINVSFFHKVHLIQQQILLPLSSGHISHSIPSYGLYLGHFNPNSTLSPTCLTLYPPSWHSASTTIPSSLLLSALPEFLVKDRSDCIPSLLKNFSASHFTQKPEPIQRPIRSCMVCLLPLQSS